MFVNFRGAKKLWEKLRKKEYRDGYVAEHVRRGIAYQIRALRDQRDWSQGKFSQILGKPQSVVCRLEDPGYGKVTVQTLLELASTFDVALQVRFTSFSSFIQETRNVSPAALQVPSFTEDFQAAPAKLSFVDIQQMPRSSISERAPENEPVRIDVSAGIQGTITIQTLQ